MSPHGCIKHDVLWIESDNSVPSLCAVSSCWGSSARWHGQPREERGRKSVRVSPDLWDCWLDRETVCRKIPIAEKEGRGSGHRLPETKIWVQALVTGDKMSQSERQSEESLRDSYWQEDSCVSSAGEAERLCNIAVWMKGLQREMLITSCWCKGLIPKLGSRVISSDCVSLCPKDWDRFWKFLHQNRQLHLLHWDCDSKWEPPRIVNLYIWFL